TVQRRAELRRHEQDYRPGVPLADRLSMDELDAADIQAARWLVEDQERQVAGELARDDELLLIAAGERSGADRRGGRANVVLADALLGSCLDRLVVAQEAARVGSPVVVGQDEVVGKR